MSSSDSSTLEKCEENHLAIPPDAQVRPKIRERLAREDALSGTPNDNRGVRAPSARLDDEAYLFEEEARAP